MFDIDVVIPTAKQLDRLDNLMCVISTALNSGLKVRVYMVMEGEYPELMARLSPDQLKNMAFCHNAPQGMPSIPIKYAYENLDLSDWMICLADDDCLLPWGLKHYWEAREGVAMIIAQTLGVSRDSHYNLSIWKIGRRIIPCHVSSAMVHIPSLRSLPKPWYEVDPLSDYLLTKKISESFPYRIIPNVAHCQAFANPEDLGDNFMQWFREAYGDILPKGDK